MVISSVDGWSSMFFSGSFPCMMSFRGTSKMRVVPSGIFALVAIVLMILAPILAQLIYFAVSRKREYLADASAAAFTRYPEGLASALEKISRAPARLASARS